VLPVGIAVADDPACEHLHGNDAFVTMLGVRDGGTVSLLRVLPGRRECGFLERYGKELKIWKMC
jgi:hypothetical protein